MKTNVIIIQENLNSIDYIDFIDSLLILFKENKVCVDKFICVLDNDLENSEELIIDEFNKIIGKKKIDIMFNFYKTKEISIYIGFENIEKEDLTYICVPSEIFKCKKLEEDLNKYIKIDKDSYDSYIKNLKKNINYGN